VVILEMGCVGGISWTSCPGWPWTVILLISASQVARITDFSPFFPHKLHNLSVYIIYQICSPKHLKKMAQLATGAAGGTRFGQDWLWIHLQYGGWGGTCEVIESKDSWRCSGLASSWSLQFAI
jgi:hypothetical protein